MARYKLPRLILALLCVSAFGAQEIVNVGSSANDSTGDSLRGAFMKVNTNFTELYGITTNAQILLWGATNSLLENGYLLVAGTNIVVSTNGNEIEINSTASGTGSIADGDKGDITVSDGGSTWLIDSGAMSGSEVTHSDTPTNYTATASNVSSHLEGIDSALGSLNGALLTDGTVAMGADLNLGGYDITNAADVYSTGNQVRRIADTNSVDAVVHGTGYSSTWNVGVTGAGNGRMRLNGLNYRSGGDPTEYMEWQMTSIGAGLTPAKGGLIFGDVNVRVGRDDSKAPQYTFQLGTNTARSSNPYGVIATKGLSGAASANWHTFGDNMRIAYDSGGYAGNSFDSYPLISGANDYDHFVGFQARPQYSGIGSFTNLYGFWSQTIIDAASEVHHAYAGYLLQPAKSGGGTLHTNIVLYLGAANVGADANWSLWSAGPAYVTGLTSENIYAPEDALLLHSYSSSDAIGLRFGESATASGIYFALSAGDSQMTIRGQNAITGTDANEYATMTMGSAGLSLNTAKGNILFPDTIGDDGGYWSITAAGVGSLASLSVGGYTALTLNDIGSSVQAYDSDLDDLSTEGSTGTGTFTRASVTAGKQDADSDLDDLSSEGSTGTGAFVRATNSTMTISALTASTLLSSSPAKGDIWVDNGTSYGPVSVGTDGQVWMADSSQTRGVKWAGVPCSYVIPLTNQVDAVATGTNYAVFRMPHAMTVSEVRVSLLIAQSSGDLLTVDILESGTTILSTKLTIDNSETTSTTADAAAVISDTALADDAVISFNIDAVGTGGVGPVVIINGTR